MKNPPLITRDEEAQLRKMLERIPLSTVLHALGRLTRDRGKRASPTRRGDFEHAAKICDAAAIEVQ